MTNKLHRHITLLFATATVVIVANLVAPFEAGAQSRPIVRKHRSIKRKPPTQVPPAVDPPAKPILSPRSEPVAIVNLAKPDYLSGEASVTVNPKQPTVIRLGLAQNAVSLVEFPAADGIYYVHEGNPKLASIFQSPTRETDRSITIYPGEGFVANGESSPSAAITLQMRSGLVIILELVPVSDIRNNAHRCVVNYRRDEVIDARRAAGLAYDLGEDAKSLAGKAAKALSKHFGNAENSVPAPAPGTSVSPTVIKPVESLPGSEEVRSARTDAEIARLANKRLAETLTNPKKHLGEWSNVVSGLSLASSKIVDIDRERRIVVVAVKNVTMNTLRLVKDAPELQLQTQDEKGNPLQTERIERDHTETTTPDGVILPGSTVYYAMVYRPPTMGVNQRLRLLFTHSEAANSPVIVSLSNANDGRRNR